MGVLYPMEEMVVKIVSCLYDRMYACTYAGMNVCMYAGMNV